MIFPSGDATRTSATRLHEAMKITKGQINYLTLELAKSRIKRRRALCSQKGFKLLGNHISKIACEVTGGISSEIGDWLTVSPDTIKNIGQLLERNSQWI